MSSTQEKGNAFEEEVAYLYRTLGYKVERNVSLQGHQIDIIATINIPGGISTKTAIECKYKESGFLPKNSVMDNINALKDIRYTNEVQNLIIITTHGFTKDLSSTARANKIELQTIEELYIEIIDARTYIDRIIYDFEHYEEYSDGQRKPIIDLLQRANLYKHYINLRFRDSKDNVYDQVEKYIESWLIKNDKNHIVILGDYGTGKSSFLLYLTYIFAKSFKEKPFSVPIPVFISLKRYHSLKEIKEQILEMMKNEYNLIIPSPLYFQKLLEDGKLILFLDGFDEMESKSNKDIIFKNFEEIIKLVTKSSKIILTSRTHYFKTHAQVRDIFNPQYDTDLLKMIRDDSRFEILELLEFNDSQIIEFLSKRSDEYTRLWAKIKSTYNLEDLSKRPILLEMIIRSLPTIIKAEKAINSSQLYQIYTDIWIKREDWRSIMNPDEKAIFMEELALTMFLSNSQEVHYSQLTEIVSEHFKRRINSKEDEDIFDMDTRTCSFLNRDYDGNYKFIHKSFMEFFVSKKLYKEIVAQEPKFLKEKSLLPEILDFLSKMNIDKIKLYNIIHSTSNSSFNNAKYMGGNSISILNLMGETFTNKNFSKTILRSASFENSVCDGSDFSYSDLQEANFIDASLLYTNFVGANIKDALIEDIGYVTYISIDKKEETLAFGTLAGYLFIFDLNTFKKTSIMRDTSNPIIKIKFFDKNKKMGVIDSKKNVFVYQFPDIGKPTFKLLDCETIGSDFDETKPEIALLNKRGQVKLINIETNVEKLVDIVKSSEMIINNMAYDGKNIYTLDNESTLIILDIHDKSTIKVKTNLTNATTLEYNSIENLLYLRQIEEIEKLRKIRSMYEADTEKRNYTYSVKYEIIYLGKLKSEIINSGIMGAISSESKLLFDCDISVDEYDQKPINKFKIRNLETGAVYKESYNIALSMAYEKILGKDNGHEYLPHTVFSKKYIYISDFSGKLVQWEWKTEPSLEGKQTKDTGFGRSSVVKTMLKSRFINENIFKCDHMNISNVVGLSKDQLVALMRVGATYQEWHPYD